MLHLQPICKSIMSLFIYSAVSLELRTNSITTHMMEQMRRLMITKLDLMPQRKLQINLPLYKHYKYKIKSVINITFLCV